MADDNTETGTVHTKALLKIMQRVRKGKKLSYIPQSKLLNSVLWHECTRGGATLRHYIFDPEQVVDHKHFRATFERLKVELIDLGFWPSKAVDGFACSDLDTHAMLRLHEICYLLDMNFALGFAPEKVDEQLMNAYVFAAIFSCNEMLKICARADKVIRSRAADRAKQAAPKGLACIESPSVRFQFQSAGPDMTILESNGCGDPALLDYAYQRRAAALAGEFALRAFTSHEAVDIERTPVSQLYRIYGTQKPVLSGVREAYQYCVCSGQVHRQTELWLWILWVTTLAERADLHPCYDDNKIIDGFFNIAFADHALAMGLHEWSEVVEVLLRFMYHERTTSQSEHWFRQACQRSILVAMPTIDH
jgi:hypothetical protein